MAVIPSPLSSSIGGINESTVSGSVFGANRQDVETKSKLQSLTSSITSLQNQVSELNKNNISNIGVFTNFQKSFATQVDSIRLQLNKVDDTLESVATIIASESVIEKQKDYYEAEKEKRLAESGARSGQESLLETKIQSALSEPINRIGNQVSFGFQNLMGFITTLLGGWLTVQGIETIKAYQEGDKKSLDDIKNSVIKTLLIAGGIFGIVNFGIIRFTSTIVGLVGKIGKFVLSNTIGKLFGGISSLFKSASKVATGAGAKKVAAGTRVVATGAGEGLGGIWRSFKGAGEGLIGNVGKIFKGVLKGASPLVNPILGTVDFMQRKGEGQTNIQAGGGAISSVLTSEAGIKLGSKSPGWTKLPSMALLGAGGYALGGMGSDILTGVNKSEENQKPEVAKVTSENVTTLPKETPKPEVAPVTSMIPPASNLQINQPDASKIKQYEQAWQNKDNPLARRKIEGAWNNMSSEEKQQAKDWATSKGYDWKEMKLPDIDTSVQKAPQITPAETSKLSTVPFNVGPEPEVKPNIIYTSPESSPSPPPQQALKSGPASDVPNISSSNPDNFYTLYSQINYNVVM
jgi:hypothetical protein